jgi:hypothetical protein
MSDETEILLLTEPAVEVIEDQAAAVEVLEVVVDGVEILSEGGQGPEGPPGEGFDVFLILATEDLPAGALVNVWNDGWGARVRLADAALNRRADGFVRAAAPQGTLAGVLFGGLDELPYTVTPGVQYLRQFGLADSLPPATPGWIVQRVGTAPSVSTLTFFPGDVLHLAAS